MSESPIEDVFAYLTAPRERQLREQLRKLVLEYQDKAQPIIDELVKIENAKPRWPYVILDEAGNVTPEMFERWLAGRKPEKPKSYPVQGI